MAKKSRRHPRIPHDLIGAIWILPSYPAVAAMLAEANKKSKLELYPGTQIREASFLSMSDKQGEYAVAIALGPMFSAGFLAACEILAHKHGGSRFPDEEKSRRETLITDTYRKWRKLLSKVEWTEKLK